LAVKARNAAQSKPVDRVSKPVARPSFSHLQQGARRVVESSLVRCPDCGGLWLGGLVHAPHWACGQLVDCIGREVSACRRTGVDQESVP
jgi:hypothetical protein